ncbi:hypothetical protein HRG_014799 [Hirsutella rhossiliensis]
MVGRVSETIRGNGKPVPGSRPGKPATYEADRAEVLKSDDPEDITIATSSSQRKGKVGLGGVVRDASRDSADEVLTSYSVTLGSSDEQNAYTAGLEAIAMALSMDRRGTMY